MGEKNSINKLKEMKLTFALAALASADVRDDWDSFPGYGGCGSRIEGPSMVNSTCTVIGDNIKRMHAGNGAFIVNGNQLTGFDGVSSNVELYIDFDQNCEDGVCDNSTCWDAFVSCEYNGEAKGGMMFMDTSGTNLSDPSLLSLQIANVEENSTITVTLVDGNGVGVGLQNITVLDHSGEVGSASSADGKFTVNVGEYIYYWGDFFTILVTPDTRVDLFKSTVV